METFKFSKVMLGASLLICAASCKKAEVTPSNNLSSSATQNAAVVIHSSQKVDDASDNWDPCTNEWIHFTGYAQITTSFTINDNRVTGVFHYNAEGEKGVGLSSGTQYRGVGGYTSSFSGSLVNGSYTQSFTSRITMVALGKGNNFVQGAIQKFTINAKGEITVAKAEFTITCQ
jgi:hypothetical protein